MKKTLLVILNLDLIAGATLHAQASTGTIAGRITDPTSIGSAAGDSFSNR